MSVAQVTQFLALLVMVSQIAAAGVILTWLVFPRKRKKIVGYFAAQANLFAFLVALTSMLGSLYYSDIALYSPCKLCWYQRILMYPQALLFLIVLCKKEKITDYILGLSIVGMVISGYHYLLQNGVVPSGSCGVVGYSVSCAQRFVMTFGYITIPLMALTGFVLIILLMIAQKISKK